MASTSSNSFINSHWRQLLFSRKQRNFGVNFNLSNNNNNSTCCPTKNDQSSNSGQPRFWLLTCCVTPQSTFTRVRIDRSMISPPTDFRHIGHMGADDLSSTYNENAVNSLLSSKGNDEFSIPVPKNFRFKDVPISVAN